MSENEIKKNNSSEKQRLTPRRTIEKSPVQETPVEAERDYFNDIEIFDIDAARRAKQSENQIEKNESVKKEEKNLNEAPVFSEREVHLPDALGLTVEEKKSPAKSAPANVKKAADVEKNVRRE